MGAARAAFVMFVLLGAASAQQFLSRFSCGDLVERFGAGPAKADVAMGPIERLAQILQMLLRDEGLGARSTVTLNGNTKSNILLARCTPEEVGVVQSVLVQLRREDLQRVRLQCSLLMMPAALVKVHDLKPDAFAPTDETTFGKLVRDAVKLKGVLQNLPETIVEPLVPFVVEPAAKPGVRVPVDDPTLRLRGEMVPVKVGGAAFAVQLVRGTLPEDRTEMPKETLLHRAFRLEAGKAVMAVVVAGDQATVVFVRCLEIASEAPKKGDAGR